MNQMDSHNSNNNNNNNNDDAVYSDPASVADEVPSNNNNNNKEDGNGNRSEDQAQDLRCPICLDFYIEPERTDCSHTFCKFCITYWFHNRGRSMCPQCRHTVQRTTPAVDMSQKVEEYVATHLTQELKNEREKMRQSRHQEMSQAAAATAAATSPASGRRRRNRTRNVTSSHQESFPEFPEQDEERLYSIQDIPWYTPTAAAAARPPSSSTRLQQAAESSGHGHNYDEDDNILNVTLSEFEVRLERAQRAYGLVVSAQRELNHQLSHLGSLALRLESYDELLNRSRPLAHANTIQSTSTSSSSNTFAADASTAYFEDMSTFDQQRQQQQTNFMNHAATPYHHYMDPTSNNNNVMTGWHQLYHHWPSPHFFGSRYYHHQQQQQNQQQDQHQRLMTINNDDDDGHSPGCHTNITEEHQNGHYGHSRPQHHASNNSNTSGGGGRYSVIVHDLLPNHVIPSCPLTSQPDPSSDTSVNVNVNLINSHVASSSSGSSRRAARAQAATAARRRREQRHGHERNGGRGRGSSLYCYGCNNNNNCTSTTWGLQGEEDDDENEEEYLERITSHLAENELAEAIERSLLLDMLELPPPAQQIAVRSSSMSTGTTATNCITRPGSGLSRRCHQQHRDPRATDDFVVMSGSGVESQSDGLSPSFDHLELLHRRHEIGSSRVSDLRRRQHRQHPDTTRRARHARL